VSQIDDLLRNAERYANVFTAGDLPTPPALRLAVVTCMDSRIDLFNLLGLHLGEAHILRNAGAVVTDDVVRSLTLSQALLGTREVMLIGHTRCGLHGDEDELRAKVAEETGAEPDGPLHAFDDVEVNVRRGLATIEACPPLRGTAHGFVYDVDTGELRKVS
jgi:carbonic anhydrase